MKQPPLAGAYPMRRGIFYSSVVVAVLLTVAALAWCGRARAHDSWINYGGYKNPVGGEHCCGVNDCPTLSKDDVEATPAGWRVKSLNETVPYSETYPSEDGLFYRCHKPDGSRRCFFAPGEGS